VAVPSSGLAIEFSDSSAAAFPKALELAKATNGFRSYPKNKKNWYFVVYLSGNLIEAMPLAELLSGIPNRRLYVDGIEKPWDEVFGFAQCAAQRAQAYRPMEYCFGKDENRLNPWGCKQAGMDWTEATSWFGYGRWERVGISGERLYWYFDKQRIRYELTLNLRRFRFCPHLQKKLCDAVLEHLPETIEPEFNSDWEYCRQYEQGAVKVAERESSGDLKTEFWAYGVRPKGIRVLAEILSKAFKDLGVNSVSVDDLLK
jgi:hypothetical protein